MNTIDLTGQKFSRLTVTERSGRMYGSALWLCMCDCGERTYVQSRDLRSGTTRSCGCLRRELSAQRLVAMKAAWRAAA